MCICAGADAYAWGVTEKDGKFVSSYAPWQESGSRGKAITETHATAADAARHANAVREADPFKCVAFIATTCTQSCSCCECVPKLPATQLIAP
jgi:hypothetical protein